MCTPGLSIGMSVISGVFKAYSMLQQGQADKRQHEYSATLADHRRQNALILRQDALDRGEIDEREERIRGQQLLGQMTAVLAGSGQDLHYGSALDLVVDQAEVNEVDALRVRNNARREARQFEIEAQYAEADAQMATVAGANAQRRGVFGAGGVLLSTAGKVADKWYSFKRDGVLR